MLKVGLTGNFYSGYDQVSELFANKNIPVFDADLVIKYMINYSDYHIGKIKKYFGDTIYFANLINLKILKKKKKVNELLDIIQVDLIKSYERWRVKNKTAPYTIFKCSILFERGLDKSMNLNISVYKPKQFRRKYIKENPTIGMTTLKLETIIENEMDELEKNKKSNYVIHNYEDRLNHSIETHIYQISRSLLSKFDNNDHTTYNSFMV